MIWGLGKWGFGGNGEMKILTFVGYFPAKFLGRSDVYINNNKC